jgi:hypothetical protein
MEAGDAPLARYFGLELREHNFVETGGLLESSKVNFKRGRTELDPGG